MMHVIILSLLTSALQQLVIHSAEVIPNQLPHLGGVLRMTFTPHRLEPRLGQTAQGHINVTTDLQRDSIKDAYMLKACCVDESIVELLSAVESHRITSHSYTELNVSVRAVRIGHTSIKFYLSRIENDEWTNLSELTTASTAGNIPQNHYSSATSTGKLSLRHIFEKTTTKFKDVSRDIWWLSTHYDVIVRHSPPFGGQYSYYIAICLIAVNFVGIGGQIDPEEIVYLVRRPAAVTLAFLCRFGVMPAVGVGIVELLKPSHVTSLGVLSVLCSPGEGASNLLLLLMEADLTMSVTITTVNNFATLGMLPLWTIFFESRLYNNPGNAMIPFRHICAIFGIITLSLTIGFYINRKHSDFYSRLWLYLPVCTVCTIICIIIVDLYNKAFIFRLITAQVFLIASVISASGFLVGAAVSFIGRQPQSALVVITIDTGVRTGYVASLLTSRSFQPPDDDISQTAPTLCALLCLVPCSVVILVRRFILRYQSKLYERATECTDMTSSEDPMGDIEDVTVEEDERGEFLDRKETSM